jgi:DNA-binding XRE family transcriptional regulator
MYFLVDSIYDKCYKSIMVKTNIIEAQREKLKISKRQFAIKIGISRQAYYDILDNKSTRTETLDKIAAVLGLSAKDLLK